MNEFPFSDTDLKQAAVKVREAMLDTVSQQPQKEHIFSQQFEQNMEQLRLREKKRKLYRTTIQRVASIFLAILLGTSVWLTVDTDARATLLRWMRTIYENKITYWYMGEPTTEELPYYALQDIPKGYYEASVVDDGTLRIIHYLDTENNGQEIIFMYHFIGNSTLTDVLNTEYTVEVFVDGDPGYFYYAKQENDANVLIWIDEETGIAFHLTAFLSKSDMLHIAETIEKIKN